MKALTLIAATAFAAVALHPHAQVQPTRSPTPAPVDPPFRTEVFAEGLVHPWGIALLPDGRLLVTERPGRMRIVRRDGSLSPPLGNVPEVFSRGQGGLLDVVLGPDFEQTRRIYFSFSEPGEGGTAGTAVARARLGEQALQDVEVIWRQVPKVRGPNHFGSRLAFRPDGTLLITTGERFDYKEEAQDLSNTLGVIARIEPDGGVPKDNPFVGRKNARDDIWSYGHRNIQAAATHPQSGRLWIVEHGPRGGDELQSVIEGANYGWPAQTFGINYDGTPVTAGGEVTAEMRLPLYYWDPVIAPSGAVFLDGGLVPEWKGDLLIGSLQPGGLVRLRLANERVVEEARYREGLLDTRIRDLEQGPGGEVYAATDQRNGRILRLQR